MVLPRPVRRRIVHTGWLCQVVRFRNRSRPGLLGYRAGSRWCLQAEPDRPPGPGMAGPGRGVAQRIGHELRHHDRDVRAAFCHAPPVQGGDGEVPGGADRSGIRAERPRGDPRQPGPVRDLPWGRTAGPNAARPADGLRWQPRPWSGRTAALALTPLKAPGFIVSGFGLFTVPARNHSQINMRSTVSLFTGLCGVACGQFRLPSSCTWSE